MLDKINIVKTVINKVYTEGIQRKNSLQGGGNVRGEGNQRRIKLGAIDAAIGPRSRTGKRKISYILVVISVVCITSGKSIKFLPRDIIF